MGILSSLVKDATLGGVQGVFEGIVSLAKDIRSAITGEVSPEAKAKIEEGLLKLESMAQEGQLKVNEQEAKHPSVWVSGWRPGVGWVCVVSLGSYFIPQYLMAAVLWTKACWVANALLPYPIAEPKGILELVIGMLGLAVFRSYEKRTGVARS